jgi:crotonobetainyl-CoA:carnitine CoA-transferase CaiB-like acyl-CoA transferase
LRIDVGSLPLERAHVVEVVRCGPPAITDIAIAFAGRVMATLGARVTRVVEGGRDPLLDWPPMLADGSSALHRFLTAAKTTVIDMPLTAGTLLCDDPARVKAWSGGSTVLIEPERGRPRAAASELTVLAASGLLDIVGEPGAPPLPLPGHQTAYAAGIAAFDALVCAHFAQITGQPVLHQRVSVLDVALWLNWKQYLAAYLHLADAGIGRPEEWRTYRCRDGFIAFVFQDKDMAAVGRLTGGARLTEARFATPRSRRENIAAFCELVAEWACEHTREEIVSKARSLGLPVGPVLAIDELLSDRQMLAREFIDLAGGSSTFGLPRLPVTWAHATIDHSAIEGAGADRGVSVERRA